MTRAIERPVPNDDYLVLDRFSTRKKLLLVYVNKNIYYERQKCRCGYVKRDQNVWNKEGNMNTLN